jgi:hypothetical protein
MSKIIAAIVAFFRRLFGLKDDTPLTAAPPPAPVAGPWSFQYSPGMPARITNTFDFPAVDGAHYLVKPCGPLAGVISITYRIETAGAPVFDYRTNPDNTCGPGFPGTVTLYFQKGNDWSGEFSRWFAIATTRALQEGTYTIEAPLDPALWVSVYGKRGSDFPTEFNSARATGGSIGMVFGGGCFVGHGVFVTGGAARFTILEFKP